MPQPDLIKAHGYIPDSSHPNTNSCMAAKRTAVKKAA
jgi:hypothetical protein